AAVLLRDDRAEVALIGDLPHQLQVEVVVARVFAPLHDALLVGEVARRVLAQALLVGQVEVHPAPLSYSFGVVHGALTRRSISSAMPSIGTRSCASESRSRSVTVRSSTLWWSIVRQNGVPISSWRR